jgi:prephenate dehydrogenase
VPSLRPWVARCRRRPSLLPEQRPGPAIGIAGVGLIGGSIGLRARELGWAVLGWDPDPEAVAVGLRRGALSAAAESLHSLSEGAGVLVLAGPVDATLGHLAELVRAGSPAPLVIDVGSVKAGVARAGRELAAFVPTHPIAGSESSGAEAARADLFRGRIWTYDPVALPPARELALRFIAAMGAAPFAIDSRAHDRTIALTSHLPQLLSAALGARLEPRLHEPETLPLCGSGMRSMLRLGASSFSMWEPILSANAGPLAQEVGALAAILTEAARSLERGETGELGALFEAAAASAARLRADDDAPGDARSLQTVKDER